MVRLLLIPLALVAMLAAAMVWSRGEDTRPADFVFINRGELNTLDPNAMSWVQDIRIANSLWDGLYTNDPALGRPVPGAAERVEISPDGRVYTFHLRPDGRWSNGDPVRSHDFVFAWRRSLEHPSYYTYLLHYIEGAFEYQQMVGRGEQADFFEVVGVESIDDLTLRVRLTNPVVFFPDLCAFPPLFPLHEPSMRPFAETGPDGRTRYRTEFMRAGNLVTNGPYRLDQWQFKRRVRLVASEYYWDRENVRSQIVDAISFDDPQAAFLKYESGGVDWLSHVSTELSPELRAAGREDLRIFPGFGTYFFTIRCDPLLPDGTPNPFADYRVRQALAMAIDKQPIVDALTRLGEPVATSFTPPGAIDGYDPPAGLPFDPEQARAVLAEAGYPGGQGIPQVTVLFNNEGDHRLIAQNLRHQWERQLGIRVNLEGVEVGTFRQRTNSRQYVIARSGWIGDYHDPSTFTDKYLSTSDNNTAGWKSEEFDRLCAEAAAETDPDRRFRLLEQAEHILLNEAPIIPIYHYVTVYMFRDNVHGIYPRPQSKIMFKHIYADPPQ